VRAIIGYATHMAYGAKFLKDKSGAKNGGGAWMPRADAKAFGKKVRRARDRAAVREAMGR
jgi:hypothetical protein